VQVPEKYVPHFKAGKELRERVDSATEEAQAAMREPASQPAR
jgi:integration host factor subunit beta